MTRKLLDNELLYHASLSPFKSMLKEGIISEDDYLAIDTILRVQYSPLFVEKSYQIPLDNKQK